MNKLSIKVRDMVFFDYNDIAAMSIKVCRMGEGEVLLTLALPRDGRKQIPNADAGRGGRREGVFEDGLQGRQKFACPNSDIVEGASRKGGRKHARQGADEDRCQGGLSLACLGEGAHYYKIWKI